jgi:hypothetical protein
VATINDRIDDFVQSLDDEDFFELQRTVEYRVRAEAEMREDLEYLRESEDACGFTHFVLWRRPDACLLATGSWLRRLVRKPNGQAVSGRAIAAYVKERAIQLGAC